MKLTNKEKQLVREYAKKVIGNRLNEVANDQYTIIKNRKGREVPVTDTLENLIRYFSYTLEKGNSWDKKVIKDPNKLMKMPIDKFVSNLNRAKDAATGNGYDASTVYSVG